MCRYDAIKELRNEIGQAMAERCERAKKETARKESGTIFAINNSRVEGCRTPTASACTSAPKHTIERQRLALQQQQRSEETAAPNSASDCTAQNTETKRAGGERHQQSDTARAVQEQRSLKHFPQPHNHTSTANRCTDASERMRMRQRSKKRNEETVQMRCVGLRIKRRRRAQVKRWR